MLLNKGNSLTSPYSERDQEWSLLMEHFTRLHRAKFMYLENLQAAEHAKNYMPSLETK